MLVWGFALCAFSLKIKILVGCEWKSQMGLGMPQSFWSSEKCALSQCVGHSGEVKEAQYV